MIPVPIAKAMPARSHADVAMPTISRPRRLCCVTARAVLGTVFAAALFAGIVLVPSSSSGPNAAPRPAPMAAEDAARVDVLLVLAVDVSYSMDMDELAIQREGYAQALVSPDFMRALKDGANGRIAAAYFDWAAAEDQRLVVPWRIIDGPESAGAVANEIANAPLRRASRTSISGAMYYGRKLFAEAPYKGLRKVIDISGDGPNNNGQLVTIARDELVNEGITINGLPIVAKYNSTFGMDIANLDIYYEDCMIGGAGAFVVPIRERDKFKEAIRTKLVMEVAGRMPQMRVVPVAAERTPRISCTIGEKLWQERWGR